MPPAHQLPERLVTVLAVIYALFNEGYGASTGADLIRKGLCAEAIHLGRLLAELMPNEPEALGCSASWSSTTLDGRRAWTAPGTS